MVGFAGGGGGGRGRWPSLGGVSRGFPQVQHTVMSFKLINIDIGKPIDPILIHIVV